jgi:hypothetical protein
MYKLCHIVHCPTYCYLIIIFMVMLSKLSFGYLLVLFWKAWRYCVDCVRRYLVMYEYMNV